MRAFLVRHFLVAGLLLAGILAAPGVSDASPVAWHSSVFRIFSFDAQGTAFAVSEHLLVTANHVVSAAPYAYIEIHGGKKKVNVVLRNTQADLAILETSESLTPLRVLSVQVSEGTQVDALAAPRGHLGQNHGEIVGVSAIAGLPYYSVDAFIDHGSSGGALVDDRGFVVGIIEMTSTDSPHIGYALTSTVVTRFLNHQLPGSKSVRPTQATTGTNISSLMLPALTVLFLLITVLLVLRNTVLRSKKSINFQELGKIDVVLGAIFLEDIGDKSGQSESSN
jgi:S1-C subfamily serine protease